MFNSLQNNPPNRYTRETVEWEGLAPKAKLEVPEDHSRDILSRNISPGVGFSCSVNRVSRVHACVQLLLCAAVSQKLELGVGTDFERRILIKPRAVQLLQAELDRPRWRGEVIAFSGATDAWQPLERRYELTRRCLGVCAAYRQPVTVFTRSPLILRDLDLLTLLADQRAVRVQISIPVLDRNHARVLEPGAAPPELRLSALRTLSEAGIPVGVSLAPLIPGLTDSLVPKALIAAREAGAQWAFMTLLRLPGSGATFFEQRLRECLPEQAEKVMNRLNSAAGVTRAGFGQRLKGRGESWNTIHALFELWKRKLGYDSPRPWPPSSFRRPGQGEQLALF